MRKIILSIVIALLAVCSVNFVSTADEISNETEFNVFAGMFDFNDNKDGA